MKKTKLVKEVGKATKNKKVAALVGIAALSAGGLLLAHKLKKSVEDDADEDFFEGMDEEEVAEGESATEESTESTEETTEESEEEPEESVEEPEAEEDAEEATEATEESEVEEETEEATEATEEPEEKTEE